MANQYEVLGKAPEFKDLQKLSGSNLHLQIKNLKNYIYFKNGYFYGKGELGNFPIDKY